MPNTKFNIFKNVPFFHGKKAALFIMREFLCIEFGIWRSQSSLFSCVALAAHFLMKEDVAMALMKQLKVQHNPYGSKLIESAPPDRSMRLGIAKGKLMELMNKDEEVRLSWHGYMYADQNEEYTTYESAVFMFTGKRLLVAQIFENNTEITEADMKDFLGYSIRNAESYVLPEFNIYFRWEIVTFLCPWDVAVGLEPKLVKQLHRARYNI